jgi:transketolase
MIKFTPATTRMWSILGSAGTFGVAALELPDMDEETLVVTADLRNFSGLDRFGTAHPDRLINVGIAEQNLVGVSAGLASEGYHVFATTYATFASARAADPVRVNMGYMGLPVKLVGLASGFSVGVLGPTHMGLEDLAIMRSIPNITVISPADCTETVKATLALADHPGPAYLRLGGGVPEPVVYKTDYDFEIGKAIRLRDGDEVVIVATGSMVHQSLGAADILADHGISVAVIDMHTVKPLDHAALDSAMSGAQLLVTVEEHTVCGGLGSAVAEHKTTVAGAPPQLILGVNDYFPHAGDYNHLVEQAGLTSPQIAEAILHRLNLLVQASRSEDVRIG